MATSDKREHERFRVVLGATVFLEHDSIGTRCCIRDASASGCLIVSSRVREFPDDLELVIDGIEQPLFAKIVWRSGKTAGLKFDWPSSREGDWVAEDWIDLSNELILDS